MTRRVAGVVALLIAAVLVFAGTFLPLYTQLWDLGGTPRFIWTIEQTSWLVRSDRQAVFGRGALFGVPMVVGALLMVLGAARAGVRWGRLLAFAGSLLLMGGTWAVAQYVFAMHFVDKPDDVNITTTIGPGMWTLLVAGVLAVAGGLLVQEWPPRAPRPEGAVVYQIEGADDDTPPFGIPVAELPVTTFGDPYPAGTGVGADVDPTPRPGTGTGVGEPGGRTGP